MLKIVYFLIIFSCALFADQPNKPAFFRLHLRQNIPEVGRQQRVINAMNFNQNAREMTVQIQSNDFIRDIDFSLYPKKSAFKNFVGACLPGIGVVVGAQALVKLYDGPLQTKKNEVMHDIRKEYMMSNFEYILLNENVLMRRPVYFYCRQEIANQHIDAHGMTGKEKMQFAALNTGIVCVSTLMTSIWIKCIRNYFTE